MPILAAYLTPHPPLILKEIGRGEEKKVKSTIEAMEKISKKIASLKPQTIIVISPHGPLFSDGISIMYEKELIGDFNKFGEYTINYQRENDIELIDRFTKIMKEKYRLSGALIDKKTAKHFRTSFELDHGTLVPLYFVDKEYKSYELIAITYGMLSYQDLYKVGMALSDAVEEIERDVVVIASGDLSHRLKDSGPYDYNPAGEIFDEKILELLVNKRNTEIIAMDPEFCEEAGECGKRSIDILLGTLDSYDYDVEKLSYEGPFGVGYGVVSFENLRPDDESLVEDIEKTRMEYVKEAMDKEDGFVKLARDTINLFVKSKERLNFKESEYYKIDDLKSIKKGVFVSIKDSGGLRGCIGTFLPTRHCIGEEIVENAISAATRDPRFSAIEAYELNDLIITVDVLNTPKGVQDKSELDPLTYGVIVTSDYKRGLLLPNLKGIDTVEKQLKIALNKAGIDVRENYTIEKFTITRH
ncbi:MAG: AmmeMemoRadiSam system protein A [Bacillota bacterium]|nr:AmmeMemoRadiSam system protein A [Bacillota bacterium]